MLYDNLTTDVNATIDGSAYPRWNITLNYSKVYYGVEYYYSY